MCISVELKALVAIGWFAANRVWAWLKGCNDAAALTEGRRLEDPVVMAGVVDARGHENGRATAVVQARFDVEIMDDAQGDAPLALPGTHQLLHRGPTSTNDVLLKVIQIFGLLREILFNSLRRRNALRNIPSLVFQIKDHTIGDGLGEFIGVNKCAKNIARSQL